jgi:hypothetical protein
MINAITDRVGRGGWRGGLLLVVLVIAAYYLGTRRVVISVHSGQQFSEVGSVITVNADGWPYSVPVDGVVWYDAAGGHNGGRPSCLESGGLAKTFRFGTVETSNDGVDIRAVIWVDCR